VTTVYWSPWYQNSNIYTENYLAHYPMDSVYKDLSEHKETRNVRDNFFNCHAFKNFCKDLYLLRNPYSIDLEYFPQENRFRSRKKPKGSMMDLSVTTQAKEPSVKDCLTVNYCVNWIYFADKPVTIQTMSPFMHNSEIYKTSYYVPGSYDISQWFRPFEVAVQMRPNETSLKSNEREPLVYAKFISEEPIEFKRFYLTESLINHSTSCISLKKFKSFKSFPEMYKVFSSTFLKKRILNEIKQNVIES